MSSFFPLYTYNEDGTVKSRKKISDADATSRAGLDDFGYFTPEDVWSVSLEDLQNALVWNSQVPFALIDQRKQLNGAKICFMYQTRHYKDQQFVFRWNEVINRYEGPVPSSPIMGHVHRPNYDQLQISPTPDGLGVWNDQWFGASHYLVRFAHLATSTAVVNENTSSYLSGQQPGNWRFTPKSNPIIQIDLGTNSGYGDVFTFNVANPDGYVQGMWTTRCKTDNGLWVRESNFGNPFWNWTSSSFDKQNPPNFFNSPNAVWHGMFCKENGGTEIYCFGNDYVEKDNVQMTVVVLEPNPYMEVYFCLARSKNYEAQLNALLGNFERVIEIVLRGDAGRTVTTGDVFEICVALNWFNRTTNPPSLTLTANQFVSNLIANNADPRHYASLTTSVRSLIIDFARRCVTEQNVNLDAAYRRFAAAQYVEAPANLLQTFPEVGCLMSDLFMENYWLSLSEQLAIPSALQKPECFFGPCLSPENLVKTNTLLRAGGKNPACDLYIACFNYQTTSITNSGRIVGNLSVKNESVCNSLVKEFFPDNGGSGGGGGEGGGGGGGGGGSGGGGSTSSSSLGAGAIAGIALGVFFVFLVLGLGLGFGLKKFNQIK